MATVKMKKGDLYADIFDSEETIKNAQRAGYSLVDEKDTKNDDNENPDEENASSDDVEDDVGNTEPTETDEENDIESDETYDCENKGTSKKRFGLF